MCDTAGFQHTAARRRLATAARPKHPTWCFNTQPPEGGWVAAWVSLPFLFLFQHTAARRRLGFLRLRRRLPPPVSTHSRPKAAAWAVRRWWYSWRVSTHSRPKAAAITLAVAMRWICRFNTQPPEGGCANHWAGWLHFGVSTHSRPKAAAFYTQASGDSMRFQHTAARRRLRTGP